MHDVPLQEEEALEALLEKYLPIVRAVVARRMGRVLRSQEESLDVVQSVCRRALERSRQADTRDEKRFLAWLLRIVERKLIDRHREINTRKRGHPPAALETPDSLSRASTDSAPGTPSVVAQRNETVAVVREAIERLPPELGEALRFNQFEGVSYEGLAQRLGITPKQARVRVAKAKMILAQMLREAGP